MQIAKNQMFEVVGIVAVVFSLIFVAYELRQSNKIAIVSNVNEIYDRFTDLNEALMSDPELARLILKANKAQKISDLTESEQLRLSSWHHFLLNIWTPANIAYDNGQLAESIYNVLFDDARSELQVAGPVGRRIWKKYVDTYPALSELTILKFIKSELDSYEARGEIADDA